MSPSTSKRLFALVAVTLLFVSYLLTRDSVRVKGNLPKHTVKQIVSQAEEWSAPKLFRHIEVEAKDTDLILATIRGQRGHWSVTVFTNPAGVWKKGGGSLAGEIRAGMVRPPTGRPLAYFFIGSNGWQRTPL